MKDSGIDAKCLHLPGTITCKYRCRHCDSNLVVEETAEMPISNQSFVPFHDWLTAIKVEITDVEETVNLMD